ncbi:MAG: homoserine O-acetyltransferase [Chloroflexi bacterium]|nr:homoserine O-acetyltransferase [Chloroflexota bacterium]
MMDRVAKKRFSLPGFRFDDGHVLNVEIGYETYGELNAARDNAVLICHYWTGTSHAAGRYAPDDELPGWWDALIGPGKAIDTDRFFVICSDTLSNVQARDPRVISTGPASIDPSTGKPFGSRYPALTFGDIVRVQRALMAHLGVEHLHAVGGPSGGGMQALEWACAYPHFVDRAFGVCTYGRTSPNFTLGVYRWCRDLIHADPNWRGGDYYDGSGPEQGLKQALQVMTLLAQTPARINQVGRAAGWGVADEDGRFPFEKELDAFIETRATYADANALLTIGRAATVFDVGAGRGGFSRALANVRADILLIPCEQDLFFPPSDSEDVVRAVQAGGGRAELYPVSSDWGHFACVFHTDLFAQRIHDFLLSGGAS